MSDFGFDILTFDQINEPFFPQHPPDPKKILIQLFLPPAFQSVD